jgi:transposase
MKAFGLLVPAGKGSIFEKNVRSLLGDQAGLASIVLPMPGSLASHSPLRRELGRQSVRDARQNQARRILMSITGIGAITSIAFTTGAWIGLTPRRRSRL